MRLQEKKDGGVELSKDDFIGMYLPEWIPKGFNIVGIDIVPNMNTISYEDNDSNLIRFCIYTNSSSVSFDNENIEEEKLYLHDSWGKVTLKEGRVSVIWEDSDYIYAIMGEAEFKDQLIKMAEKAVKIVEDE